MGTDRRLTATMLLVLVVGACSDAGDSSTSAAQALPPSDTKTATSPAGDTATSSEPSPESSFTDLDELADHLDQGGDWLTAGAGGVWITNGQGIERLDPATGDLVAEISV